MRKPSFRSASTVLLILAVTVPAGFAKKKEKYQTHPIVPEKELLIIDPAVVDSSYANYPGAFSFGHLMEQLAGDQDVSEFVRDWLGAWEQDQVINDQTVAARKAIGERLIDPWKAKDGFADAARDDWKVDLANAPFRLLAVVNRIDMSGIINLSGSTPSFGNSGSAGYYEGTAPNGEFRLVFGATDQAGEPLEGGFTTIFEYALPEVEFKKRLRNGRIPDVWGAGPFPKPSEAQKSLNARKAVAKYAARWHALGAYEEFNDEYLAKLAELAAESTDRTGVKKKKIAPRLSQLRTNEGAFGEVQEAREFDYSNGELVPNTVAATPDLRFMQDPEVLRAFTKFINDNDDSIRKVQHTIPVTVQDPRNAKQQLPFLAGSALMPKDGDELFFWNAKKIRDAEALRIFSLNTCNGCHCGETETGFYHIQPRRAGETSELSKFLRMDQSKFVVDPPNGRGRKVEFNEMAQRTVVFEALLNPHLSESQIGRLLRHRTKAVH
ncbi:MAG: hypothetical protein ACI8XO_001440 [Verrucomicrobiales bacterium]|jgi:hypothetical protein